MAAIGEMEKKGPGEHQEDIEVLYKFHPPRSRDPDNVDPLDHGDAETDYKRFWDSQRSWPSKLGLRVIRAAQSSNLSSRRGREVWTLVVESTVGYWEKPKGKRGVEPGRGVKNLWEELRDTRAITLPYRDPRNGAAVLFEEEFHTDGWRDTIWDDFPWWARGIGFRVIQSTQTGPYQSVAATLPPEVLFIICEFGQQMTEAAGVSQLALTCRAWAVKRHQFLFNHIVRGRPVDRVDAPRYMAIAALNTSALWFMDKEENAPPGWIRRYISLHTAARDRLSASGQQQGVKVHLDIDVGNVLSPQPRLQCRSIFPLCPKSLPPSTLHNLKSLGLSYYDFRSFADLMHLIWGLPGLQYLSCLMVSWKEFHVLRPPSKRIQSHRSFTVDPRPSPSSYRAPLILLLTSVFEIQEEGAWGILGSADAASLASLTGLVELILESRAVVSYNRNKQVLRATIKRKTHTLELQFRLSQGPASATHSLHVSSLHLFLPCNFPIAEYCWPKIGQNVARLLWGPEETLTISFASSADRDQRRKDGFCVAASIAHQLPDIHGAGQLKFRIAKVLDVGKGYVETNIIETEELIFEQQPSSQSSFVEPSPITHEANNLV